MEDDKENIEQFSEEEEEEMCSACDTENESVNSFEAQKEENQSLNEENENSFVLKIKRLDNSSIQVTGLTEDSDIKDLKAKLHEQIGVLPENQRLIFRGKALTSGSLKAHHIGNESWLHLVERDPSIGVQAAQPTSSDLAGRSGSERTERQQPQRISLSDALGDSMSVLLASALRSSSRAAPTAALPARNSFQFHDTSLEHIWQGLTTVNSLVDSFEEWSNRRNTSEGKIVLNELEPVFADLDGLTDYLQEGKAGDESESQETIPGIRKFECGQWIDVLDTVNQWLEATVMHVSPDGMKILVHYNAWGERWDEVLDVRSERIAPFRTKTKHRDSCQNLSATPATWVKSAPRVGNGNLNDVLPKALRSMERVLPLLRDVCTEDNAEKNLEKILYLAPMFDRMGRVLGDVASKLAENPTLATKKRLISVWPFTAVGQSIIPFSMYITAGRDLSRRNVMLKERGFDSDFLQLINHSHEPTSRSGNLDIHIHAILTPFQQTPSATEASDN